MPEESNLDHEMDLPKVNKTQTLEDNCVVENCGHEVIWNVEII